MIRRKLGIRGIEIALLDWGGEGPVALLHHANGFCAGMWAPVAESLRERFRVVAMDARGHGDSDVPVEPEAYHWSEFGGDAREVAEHLVRKIGPIALGLGHSFGGTALAIAAAEQPALFGRLMLLDPIVMPVTSPETLELRRANSRRLATGARERRQVWDSRAEAREKWASKDTFASWQPRALDLYVEEGMRERPDGRVELKCSGETEARVFENGGSVDVMERASRIECPVRILWAERGNFPREHFEALASRMQNAGVRVAATTHFVPMDDPKLVVEEVLAFQDSSG